MIPQRQVVLGNYRFADVNSPFTRGACGEIFLPTVEQQVAQEGARTYSGLTQADLVFVGSDVVEGSRVAASGSRAEALQSVLGRLKRRIEREYCLIVSDRPMALSFLLVRKAAVEVGRHRARIQEAAGRGRSGTGTETYGLIIVGNCAIIVAFLGVGSATECVGLETRDIRARTSSLNSTMA
jgi:hypothetical protein